MRMKQKISLLLFGLILFASISTAFGYHEYIYRWEDDGAVGVGCHGSATASENGTMVLTLNVTGTLEPLEEFNVTITLSGFTEALLDPYDDRFTLGIGGEMGDSPEFSSSKNENVIKRREKVDENGTYENPKDRYGNLSYSNVFILLAPANPGTYALGAVAIAGMNQTDEHYYAQIYVEGSIEITVVGPETTPAIPGFQALYIIVPSVIVAMAVLLKRKTRISEK